MKLFQIEEPEGGPTASDMPGVAIGIDASGAEAAVAVAVGGNAVTLADREGAERALPVPASGAEDAAWVALLEGARGRAERALARPVTHAVLALAAAPDAAMSARLDRGAEAAGIRLLRADAAGALRAATGAASPDFAAAILAEDLAPAIAPGESPIPDMC